MRPARAPDAPFGDLLRRYREAAGLSQDALAACADVTARAIAYLERGRRHPYPDTVRRLADALDLTVEQRATLTAAASPPPATSAQGNARPGIVPIPLT